MFRLTAIRETFEESGILLHKTGTEAGAFSFKDREMLSDWRIRVHKEPSSLLRLYREIEAVPDLWSLVEWADWLTPTDLHEKGNRRFDTMFYLASLGEVPVTVQDQLEVTASQWTDPASCLQQYYDRQLWLAPPQVYELSKMLTMTSAADLKSQARLRQCHGLSTWLPVRVECEDGLLSLLPGDHMYPDNPDYTGPSGEPGDRSVDMRGFWINSCII